MESDDLKDEIEEARRNYLQGIDELENDIRILSERIKNARENVKNILTVEDVEKFNAENDLEEGLKHIELFD